MTSQAKSMCFASIAMLLVGIHGSTSMGQTTWQGTTTAWTDAANWSNGLPTSASPVIFANGGNTTATLAAQQDLLSLSFASNALAFTLTNAGSGNLNFASGGSITSSSSVNEIVNVPLGLNGGAFSVTNTGSGTLTLGGATSLISGVAGPLQIDGTGPITFSGTGQITNAITSLNKAGSNTLTLSNTSATYVGGTNISGGTLSIANANNLGDGTVVLSNGARLLRTGTDGSITSPNSFGSRPFSIGSGGGIIELTAGNEAAEIAGALSSSGAVTLTKAGAGVLVLTGDNSGFFGDIVVNGGANNSANQTGLRLTNSAAIGNASKVTLNAGTTAGGVGNQVILSGTGIAIPSTVELVVNSVDASDFRAALYNTGGSNSWNGPITLNGSAQFYAPSAADTLTINGNITAAVGNPASTTFRGNSGNIILNGVFNSPTGNLQKTDTSTLTINSSAGNDWAATQISNGTIRLGATNALPIDATLSLGQGATHTCVFDMNGFDQTVSALTNSTTTGNNTILNNSATLSKLTVSTLSQDVYGPGSTNNRGRITGHIQLIKTGVGSLTLTAGDGAGNMDFTGGVVVHNGTLTFSGNPTYSGGNIVNAGVLRYTGGGASFTGNSDVNSGGKLQFKPTTTLALSGDVNVHGMGNLTVSSFDAGSPVVNVPTLNLASTASLTFEVLGVPFGAPLSVSTLNTSASNVINLASATPLQIAQYPLVSYSALGGAGLGGLTIGTLPQQRVIASLIDQNQTIYLNVTGFDSIRWDGANGNAWNTSLAQNWRQLSNNALTHYMQPTVPGDSVVFDDNAAANFSDIHLTGNISPGSVTFDNSTKDYVIGDSGDLTTNSIIKQGSGKATFSTSGSMNVPGAVTLSNGTLAFNRPVATTLSGILSGSGTLRQESTSVLALSGDGTGFGGNVEILGGTVSIADASNLGIGGGAVMLSNGAKLQRTGIAGDTTTPDSFGGRSFSVGAGGGVIEITGIAEGSDITGVVSGSGTLTKDGPGLLALGGDNIAFTGNVVINGGANNTLRQNGVRLLSSNALGANAKTVTLNPDTLGGGVGNQLGLRNSISIPQDITLVMQPADTFRVALVSDEGSNTWNGPIILNGLDGQTQFYAQADGQTLTIAGNITAAEDLYAGQLTLRGSVGGAFGVINGIIDLGTSGTLQKTDASTWTINSTFAAGNSWAELGVTNGTLKLGANNVSPPTAPLIMGENANSGILDLNGHNQTVANITPLGTGNRTITNADLGTPSTFTIHNAVDGAFYDSDSAAPNANAARIRGNLNLVKSGPANFVLGTLSSHDYTGTTTISNGSLIVDGTHTGGDLYTVQSGATLGGSGIIGSGVQINNGGSIAPGSASGSTFTIGGLILSNNAVGRFELENTAGAHAAGGVSDYLDIVGVLDIASVTTTVSLHISAVGGGNLAAAGSWTLLSADAINPGSWNINNIDTLFALTGISAAYSHDLEFDTNTGNLLLTTTATGVLPGDFDNDGKVNAADYVVWRKTMPGNAAKYNEWRANFGNPPGSGSGLSDDGSVPEPNALALVVLGAMALAASRRRHP